MKHLRFALVVGAFILTAMPVYTAEGAQGENAGAATAGHLITPQELRKACGSVISDARAQRIGYFEEYIRVIGSSPEFNTPDNKEETARDLRETKKLLARAKDNTIPDANWYINWSHLGPGSMLDNDMRWLNEGRDPQPFRKVIERLSGSDNAKNKIPETLAGICAMRAHVAALEGADASHLSPANGNQTSATATPVTPSPVASAGSTQTAERTLAALGALTGKSSQEALRMLTPALTAAIGRNPNIVKALAGLNALNANSIQEALAILKPLLTDAAKKNPSAAKALAALNALTADAPEDAVAVLITILAGSASKNANVAKTLASLEALPANTATVDAEGGTADNGNPTYPKITADDLVACKKEITTFHQMQIIFLKNETRTYCASGKQNEMCEHRTEWLNDSSGKRDIDWFVEGNDSCQASDYPCYGLSLYNDEEPREDLIRGLSLDTYKLPTSFEGDNWGSYSFVVDHCVAKIWMAKMDSNQTPLESNAPTSSLSSPVSDGSPKSASQNTPVTPDPAGPAGSNPNVAGLSQQQITSCSEDIKRKQVESQSWGGDVNATANRLGRFQKELFEGRCAGHPEAAKYLAGANKMLGDSGNAAGSGDTASSVSQGYVEVQGATQCVEYYVVSDKPETRTSLRKFSFGIRNTCNFPIYIGFTGYFSGRLTHTFEYFVGELPRSSTRNRYWRPGDKLETVPFNIPSNDSFHVKIDWACPIEEEATRITGKKIIHIASIKDRASCRARIYEPTSRGTAQ